MKKNKSKSLKKNKKLIDLISYRKACNVQGTGLSHYILMGKKSL